MQLVVFLVLLSYAVKCDNSNNNYYVIEVPDETPTDVRAKKTFRVYWNVPTMQCKSKKILFEDLYSKYGIIQNTGDSFRGDKIAILYDPGMFPALLKNETSGKYKFRNGGVPQEGNLEQHLKAFRSILQQSIPDEDFDGIGVIDFESWRPTFRQNFGVLVPYKDVSYEIERERHRWWPTAWIQEEARKRFEAAGRVYMQNTISVAKQMRPRALWGYYGFPYCFESGGHCAQNVPAENDNLYWLWSESTALYPSVYTSVSLTSQEQVERIKARVSEAARVRRKSNAILPYFWYRYRDDGFLSDKDLTLALKTMYNSEATGFIIWGSSSDVNTAEKCYNLLDYVENTLGPMIAKYTKPNLREDNAVADEMEETTTEQLTENNLDNRLGGVIDPELVWNPPVNYTQDIKTNVEKELLDKQEMDDDNKPLNAQDTALLQAILNALFKSTNNINAESTITENDIKKDEKKKTYNRISLESVKSMKSVENDESLDQTTLSESLTESPTSTTEMTSTEAYDASTYVYSDNQFFNQNTLFGEDYESALNITDDVRDKSTHYTESTTDLTSTPAFNKNNGNIESDLNIDETDNAKDYTNRIASVLIFNLNDTDLLNDEKTDSNNNLTTDLSNMRELENINLNKTQQEALSSIQQSNQVILNN